MVVRFKSGSIRTDYFLKMIDRYRSKSNVSIEDNFSVVLRTNKFVLLSCGWGGSVLDSLRTPNDSV